MEFFEKSEGVKALTEGRSRGTGRRAGVSGRGLGGEQEQVEGDLKEEFEEDQDQAEEKLKEELDKEQEKAEEELEEEHVLSEEDFGDNRDYPGKTRGGEIERKRAGRGGRR